jgi:hypothetical protein
MALPRRQRHQAWNSGAFDRTAASMPGIGVTERDTPAPATLYSWGLRRDGSLEFRER